MKIAQIRGADDKHAPADAGNFLVIEALQKFHSFMAWPFRPSASTTCRKTQKITLLQRTRSLLATVAENSSRMNPPLMGT
jgi:hypothetical protein